MTVLTLGCTMQTGHTSSNTPQFATLVPDGRLDFGWKLSGDRAVAPLQVFSDNTHTWLHWHPKQTVPAILADQAGQEQVLRYTRQDPYTVIEGRWSRLNFRAGRLQAHARRLEKSSGMPLSAPEQTPAQPGSTIAAHAGTTKRVTQSVAPDRETLPALNVEVTSKIYAVTAQDLHIRQALVRWSEIGGWHFQPEHWGVDVDIPLAGSASFSDDFVSSVQALLLSTELSDRPLQPCFYSNQVLRIVPYAEPCDRTIVPGAPV